MVNLSHTAAFFLSLFLYKVSAEDTIPLNCTEQFNSLVSCTALLSDLGDSCLACWTSSLPQDATDCADGETRFCTAFASCDCGSCNTEVLAITDCLVDEGVGGEGCQIDCGETTATLNPEPDTPATDDDIPEACTELFDSLVTCAAALPDLGFACLGCWSNTIPRDATDCTDGESQFCAAFESCNCESCDSQVITLTSCLVDEALGLSGCQFDCEDVTVEPDGPSEPPQTGGQITDVCPNEFNALFLCALGSPDEGGDCLDCWQQEIPGEVTDCSEGQSKICAASTKCQCGSCDQEIVAYTECLLNEVVGGEGCTLDCANLENHDAVDDTSGDSLRSLASTLALMAGMLLAFTLA